MDLSKLKEVFPADSIEWRIQRAGMNSNGPWGMALAYVTNRAIQDRLDDVCGPENWKNEFIPAPNGGVLCGISIFTSNGWVTKWDGADNTDIEAIKGGLSGAMKRAAVQWGIGRYLYHLPTGWAEFTDNGKYSAEIDGKYYKWNPPQLPSWALPKEPSYKREYEAEKEKVIQENYNRPDPEPASQGTFAKIMGLVNSKAIPDNRKVEIVQTIRPIRDDEEQLKLIYHNICYEFDLEEK